MDSRDYEKILDSMPETGIYVIQEKDHSILYFNRRVRQLCPNIREGMICHDVWGGSCENCPFKIMQSGQKCRSIGYNALFGGLVDIIAARTMWKDTIPAFVITVTPRISDVGDIHNIPEDASENSPSAILSGADSNAARPGLMPSLQSLQDRAYIIASLSSLFFSTYYVDLEHDTFRVVSQLSKVGDILGDKVNCTAALQIYANNFIYDEDRDRYLNVMNIQNWLETLRWWNPYVTIEYRTIPDNPDVSPEEYARVRATAVLARTGTDDLPKTIVYVAQNLT